MFAKSESTGGVPSESAVIVYEMPPRQYARRQVFFATNCDFRHPCTGRAGLLLAKGLFHRVGAAPRAELYAGTGSPFLPFLGFFSLGFLGGRGPAAAFIPTRAPIPAPKAPSPSAPPRLSQKFSARVARYPGQAPMLAAMIVAASSVSTTAAATSKPVKAGEAAST